MIQAFPTELLSVSLVGADLIVVVPERCGGRVRIVIDDAGQIDCRASVHVTFRGTHDVRRWN